METRRWILLAVIILAPAEGTNLEEGLTEGTNILNQLFGGQDDCDGGYKCPNGAQPRPKKGHKPSSDGCGVTMLQVDISDFPHMHKCCDKHDKCYDTCNQDKIECDSKFHSCLNQDCKRLQSRPQKECSNAANIMYTGVAVFGCQFYLQSQKQACDCSHLPKTSGRLKRDL